MNDTRNRGGLDRALGVASFALAAPLLAVPGRTVRALGLEGTRGTRALARGVGARELAAGVGVLTQPLPGLWARVAGDGMDLALLANALRSRSNSRRVVAALGAVAGIAALDLVVAAQRSRRRHPTGSTADGVTTVSAGVTVNRPIADAYGLWRDFSRLPEFMVHVESVSADGKHWVASRPGGGTVDWDAEIVADVPDQRLAWRSIEGADVVNRGEVTFAPAPGGRGTEVRVRLTYEPPFGAAGNAVARLLGEQPEQQVTDDLRRFKQVLETGEVVRSAGSPEGVSSARLVHQLPGRPHDEGS